MIKLRPLPRRLLRRILALAAASVAFYALVGFVLLPRLVRPFVARKLGEALHRTATIGKIALNPFTLAVTLSDVAVRDRDGGPFVSFENLFIDVEAVSVIKGGIVVRDIVLRGPSFTVVRVTPETYNFTDLLEEFSAPAPKPNQKPARYSLNNIRVLGGRIDFIDKPKQATHAIRDINVAVPFLSTLPYDLENYVQPAFSAVVNGTAVGLTGRTKPFSETHETTIELEFSDLSLPKYLEYVPAKFGFDLPSGLVDAKLTVGFEQRRGMAPGLTLAGRISVRNLKATEAGDKPILSLPLLDIAIGRSDLLEGRALLEVVRLEAPELHVSRNAEGKLNLEDLGPKPSGAPPGPKPDDGAPGAFVLTVAQTKLSGGTVHFRDAAPGGPFDTTLSNLDIDVQHFSTAKGQAAAVDIRVVTEAGETVHHAGKVTLDPLGDVGVIEVKGVRLKKYAPYYGPDVLVDIDTGTLDLTTQLALDLSGKRPKVTLSELAVTIANVEAHKRRDKVDLLRLESLTVSGGTVDLDKHVIEVKDVIARKGHVRIERAHDGTLNVATLVPPPSRKTIKSTPAAEEEPWSVSVAKLAAEDWGVRFDDRTPSHPVGLNTEPISVTVENFSLAKGSKFGVNVRGHLGRAGALGASGSVVLDPLAVSLKVDAKAIELLQVQPYFTDRVNLLLTSGNLSANGDLTLAAATKGLRLRYKGRVGVDRLVAVDKASSDDFLKWQVLDLSGVDLSTDPPSLAMREVALSDFYSRIAINPDATLNLKSIAAAEAAPAEPQAAAAGGATPIRVDRVTLQGGTIDFADRLIKPNFSASLHELGGRITGLSSDEASVADIDLKGKLSDYAPLEIAGKVNPLAKDLALDVKVSFHDIDLSPLSPYAGKFAGYTISKGKLFLDLDYKIQKKKLDAKNTIFVDQLNLGDSVESPTATKLPVRLAVALLKDRRGEIHINLPVTGSLDDPKFSVWGIVWDVLENLVMKAVSAPFALIGSLVGHGEELSYLEYVAGRATMDAVGAEKMKSLAKALADRPALRLDVTGHADPVTDREGLRRLLFERKVKAQKVKDLSEQGMTVSASVDEMKVDPEEWGRYLTLAYKAETFPKPRNLLGFAKDLPASEMEKLMLTHLVISEDDLRLLAGLRAQDVKDHLVRAGVPTERVFVVEPKTLAAAKKDALRPSRVDFVIK